MKTFYLAFTVVTLHGFYDLCLIKKIRLKRYCFCRKIQLIWHILASFNFLDGKWWKDHRCRLFQQTRAFNSHSVGWGKKGRCLNFNKHGSQFVCSFSKRAEGSLGKKAVLALFFRLEKLRNRNACSPRFPLQRFQRELYSRNKKYDYTFFFNLQT